MRVLYVDTIGVPHAISNTEGIGGAYDKVAEVQAFNYRHGSIKEMNQRLVDTALSFRPDLIHIGKGERIRGSAIREIKEKLGCKIIHFYGDYRPTVQPWVAGIGKYADWTLLYHKNEELWEEHRQADCKRVGFWWVGVDPNIFKPVDVPKKYDTIMMMQDFGSGQASLTGQGSRASFVLHLADQGFTVDLFGKRLGQAGGHDNINTHGFVDMHDFSRVCSQSRIALSYCTNRVRFYTSWRRIFNSMASGVMLLSHYFPGLDEVFENHKHLVWFNSHEEGAEHLRYYLDHDSEREKVAQAGRKEVLAKHTWDDRIRMMLEIAELI